MTSPPELWVSATQEATYARCPRQWALQKVFKLPVKKYQAQVLGNVLHQIAERYFSLENPSRKDLFPAGWWVSYGFNGEVEGEVTPSEALMIEGMVTKAVENGIWIRQPGALPELDILQYGDILTHDGWLIKVPGKIDVTYEDPSLGWIEDHKTTKNRNYAVSDKGLTEQLPMLLYANRYSVQHLGCNEVLLRHNTFSKDESDPFVKKAEIKVSRTFLEDRFKESLDRFHGMVALKKAGEIPLKELPPPNQSDACTAYGGCPFQRVCAGYQTIDHYRRVNNAPTKPVKTEVPMTNIAELMKKRQAITQAGGSSAPPPEKEPEAPPVEEKASSTAHEPFDPNPDCVACGGTGVNTKGGPCRACQMWHSKNKSQSATPTVQKAPEPEKEEEQPLAAAPPASEEKKKEEPSKGKRGRPPGKTSPCTLYIGCLPLSSTKIQTIEEVFVQCLRILAEGDETAPETPSQLFAWFYMKDAWKRRDALGIALSKLLEREDQPKAVFASLPTSPDLAVLVDGLTGLGAKVIRAV